MMKEKYTAPLIEAYLCRTAPILDESPADTDPHAKHNITHSDKNNEPDEWWPFDPEVKLDITMPTQHTIWDD